MSASIERVVKKEAIEESTNKLFKYTLSNGAISVMPGDVVDQNQRVFFIGKGTFIERPSSLRKVFGRKINKKKILNIQSDGVIVSLEGLSFDLAEEELYKRFFIFPKIEPKTYPQARGYFPGHGAAVNQRLLGFNDITRPDFMNKAKIQRSGNSIQLYTADGLNDLVPILKRNPVLFLPTVGAMAFVIDHGYEYYIAHKNHPELPIAKDHSHFGILPIGDDLLFIPDQKHGGSLELAYKQACEEYKYGLKNVRNAINSAPNSCIAHFNRSYIASKNKPYLLSYYLTKSKTRVPPHKFDTLNSYYLLPDIVPTLKYSGTIEQGDRLRDLVNYEKELVSGSDLYAKINRLEGGTNRYYALLEEAFALCVDSTRTYVERRNAQYLFYLWLWSRHSSSDQQLQNRVIWTYSELECIQEKKKTKKQRNFSKINASNHWIINISDNRMRAPLCSSSPQVL